MIERVAKNLSDTFGSKSVNLNNSKELFYNIAKVAVEAMKEPTEEMVFKFLGFKCDKEQPIYKMVIENYKNMIDAALKDD